MRSILTITAMVLLVCHAEAQEKKALLFKQNKNKYSFAIFADSQVSHRDNKGRVAQNSRIGTIAAIEELNAMKNQPEFVIHVGDLVNVPDSLSFEHFIECTEHAQMPNIWVHGNHDSWPPYNIFKHYQKLATGIEDTWFSWDIGKWHFVVIPCNFRDWSEDQIIEKGKLVNWLAEDLKKNKLRPTMVFGHLPLIPIGMSQLEWYTYFFDLRMKLLDLLTEHGNVKWYFNGHVHNGIKASLKMTKTYNGANFVTCPTIIESRNFGEEFSAYEAGLSKGGYYLIVEVDGEKVKVNGHLAGVNEPFVYPDQFEDFHECNEPRWFKKIVDFEPLPALVNGGFENGIEGWKTVYRYLSDEEPAFATSIDSVQKKDGSHALMIHTHAKAPEFWAHDDNNNVYQVVEAPKNGRPVLKADYLLTKRPENGGGYIRIGAIAGNEFKFQMIFKYGYNEHRTLFLPLCFGNEYYGEIFSWKWLMEQGKQRKAMFWELNDNPGSWHGLSVDLADLYDRGIGETGAFEKLGITKFHISLGTWNNKEVGSESTAWFDNISLEGVGEKLESKNNNSILHIDEQIFITNFGRQYGNNTDWHEARKNKKTIMNPPHGEICY